MAKELLGCKPIVTEQSPVCEDIFNERISTVIFSFEVSHLESHYCIFCCDYKCTQDDKQTILLLAQILLKAGIFLTSSNQPIISCF